MNNFFKVFKKKLNVIGMIHLEALPGTPNYAGNFNHIVEKAKHEAHVYKKLNVDGVLIENMHDIPYLQGDNVGYEIIASMTRISADVQRIVSPMPCGIQILASANNQAMAVAKASNLQFVRIEGFVFSHIADEGWTNSCAGTLLRYRKQIDADNVLIFADIKKKHSSHAITADINLLETAKAAEFFQADGIIITGNSTGHPIEDNDLNDVQQSGLPILIGSGCTEYNVEKYYNKCQGVIVGSHFKKNNFWKEDLNEKAIKIFMEKVIYLNEKK
ncbi:uncharacterized protein F13E9.13, mitochondrial [Condylostylus longicornis]|uniref:uncharacterized protein F13E9.13, mitochondrial n=1 Tax=Condylostylus longicornis TaxID=2530218 RepID=UPI00244E5194|nr:uncharacterized protein F13E9.13, mitochondrial [Condylostylus longicornis]